MNHRRLLCAGGALALLVSSFSFAADGTPNPAPPAAGVNSGAMHFDLGVDVQTADFFRGVRQLENAPIIKPYVTIDINVIDTDAFKFTPYIGTRNVFSERSTANPPLTYYESDIYLGFDFTFKPVTVQVGYNAYPSPNGTFRTVHEVELSAWLDDSSLWKGSGMPVTFSLNPRAGIFREVRDNNFTPFLRSDPHRLDTYIEACLTPTLTINPFGDKWPITLSAPSAVGLSPDHYYDLAGLGHTDTLGFVTVAAKGSVPLPFPERYGQWEVHAAFNWMHDYARDARTANFGKDNLVWLSTGVGIRY